MANREAVYDEQIAPLMKEIIRVAREGGGVNEIKEGTTAERQRDAWKAVAENIASGSDARGQTILRLQNRLRRWKRRAGRNNGARREWMTLAKAWEFRAKEAQDARARATSYAFCSGDVTVDLTAAGWQIHSRGLTLGACGTWRYDTSDTWPLETALQRAEGIEKALGYGVASDVLAARIEAAARAAGWQERVPTFGDWHRLAATNCFLHKGEQAFAIPRGEWGEVNRRKALAAAMERCAEHGIAVSVEP